MILRKKKVCKSCGREEYLFSRRRCSSCSAKEDHKPIQSKKAIKHISDNQVERNEKYEIAKAEHFKNFPHCEFPGCNSTDIQCHHKSRRTGENMFKNLMSVCQQHHDYIHSHIEESKENGWLL